ncbi:hypothetical protein HMPREF1546_04335 [Oscillibacter sp. KLE 1745]|nr:hypothetical protein HMPREF1546_04335 [Oscillibacter sp. KLE 1745]
MKPQNFSSGPVRAGRMFCTLLSILCSFTEMWKAITRLSACSLTNYHF